MQHVFEQFTVHLLSLYSTVLRKLVEMKMCFKHKVPQKVPFKNVISSIRFRVPCMCRQSVLKKPCLELYKLILMQQR